MHADASDRHADPLQSVGDKSGRKHVDHGGDTEFFYGDTSRGPAGETHGPGKQPPETLIGTSIGRYEITGVLGQGGMGVVFMAHDPMIERDVAVKLLSEEWSADERAVQRFLVEAKSAGKLGHPNTVAIHELGQEGQSYYLVMEYITGGSVERTLQEKGVCSVAEATRIAVDACKGLAAAHAVGLVHRDVKPANLLRNKDGTIKVADFGLVKARGASAQSITNPGQIMGTPHFMSPEQCESKPVDARSDIYSLGATYYTLLTGANPYADTRRPGPMSMAASGGRPCGGERRKCSRKKTLFTPLRQNKTNSPKLKVRLNQYKPRRDDTAIDIVSMRRLTTPIRLHHFGRFTRQ